MTFWLWGAAFAFLGGVLVGGVCYLISVQMLRRAPSRVSAFSIVRNLIQIEYFLTVYFLAPALPWDLIPLLIGAALGITVSSLYFTSRLVKVTSKWKKPPEEHSQGGENDG